MKKYRVYMELNDEIELEASDGQEAIEKAKDHYGMQSMSSMGPVYGYEEIDTLKNV